MERMPRIAASGSSGVSSIPDPREPCVMRLWLRINAQRVGADSRFGTGAEAFHLLGPGVMLVWTAPTASVVPE